jgi:UDP-glucose 4-epimerase
VQEHSTILVSGAAGFIGSHLCDGLLAAGYRVRGADNFSFGSPDNLAAAMCHPDFEFVEAELTNAADCARLCQGVFAVLHHAARVGVPASITDPASCERDTLHTTLALLSAARQARVSRFVLASTAAVYGDAHCPVTEQVPLNPLSPYGEFKRAAELAVAEFSGGASLRYFNVYGPRQSPASPYAGVITVFADRVARGLPLVVCGDGAQTRDFIHVSDVVAANIATLRHDGSLSKQPMNIGTGRGTTMLDLAGTLGRVIGRRPEISHAPARPGDIRDSWADVTTARRLIDFKARVPLEHGLRTMLEAR